MSGAFKERVGAGLTVSPSALIVSVHSVGFRSTRSNGVPGVGLPNVALKCPETSLQCFSRSEIHQSTPTSSPRARKAPITDPASSRAEEEVSASEGTTYALPEMRNCTPVSGTQNDPSAAGWARRWETLFIRVSEVKRRIEEDGVSDRWTT